MDALSARRSLLRLAALLCAVLMLLFGAIVSRRGYYIALQWGEITAPYAAIALIWIAAGAVMLTAALATFMSDATQRFPLWAGSIGGAAAGLALLAGVLTCVVPCAGPS
jgi:ABC-type polysaccharide/polyol phosphate export permease